MMVMAMDTSDAQTARSQSRASSVSQEQHMGAGDGVPRTDESTPQKSLESIPVQPVDVEKAQERGEEARDGFFVDFDGPDDIDNPKNWAPKRRWLITVCLGMLVFTVTFASSIFSVNIRVVQDRFGVGMVEGTLGVSLFVLVSIEHFAVDRIGHKILIPFPGLCLRPHSLWTYV
jgi:hypothetical protein